MKRLSETHIIEYRYESEEERTAHVKWAEAQGFECTGQVRRSDGSLWDENRESYWYAKFQKRF